MHHPFRKIFISSLTACSLLVAPALADGAMAKTPTKVTASQQLLSYGSRGQAVRTLQDKLSKLGYYHFWIDGIFGKYTRAAVINYQKAHRLVPDGIVGPKTWASLNNMRVEAASVSVNSNSALADKIIANAKSLIGTPYKWGGQSPSGFDCSGFVKYVFNKNGVDVPRTTDTLWKAGKTVSSPKKADLVFFETYKDGPSHVGIYIGDGKFIHASSSQGVTVTPMNNSYWKPRYLGAKSVLK